MELLDPDFYKHLGITLIEVAVGFVGGSILAARNNKLSRNTSFTALVVEGP